MPLIALGIAALALAVGLGLLLARRAGYAWLAGRAGTGPFTTPGVTRREAMVPMRDGVRLAADVYLPRAAGPFPAVLIRLPYGKRGLPVRVVAGFLARYGYAVVAQDTRGRYRSEGEFYPWVHEQQDGHDTTSWLAAQPWCSGKIGTWGASYFGYTQWALAPDNPHVAALVPIVTTSQIYGVYYQGGALYELGALSWAVENAGRRSRLVCGRRRRRGLERLPLIEADEAALRRIPFFDDWVRHPTPDAYWAAIDVGDRIPAVSAPAYLVAGWYDIFNGPQLSDWLAIQERGQAGLRAQSKLLVGPWSHVFINRHQAGYGIPRGSLGLPPLELIGDSKLWFDYTLKGQANGWDRRAPVRLYVLGENVWRDEQEWPPARAVYTGYYLHSDGRANTARGDGRLGTAAPAAPEPADGFTYDPLRPVPTVGGANLDLDRAGPADQRKVEARQDVLVYSTAPLEQPLEVTGPVRLTLWAGSDAPDTDFTAKLVDVFPDGRALLLCDGILRARYRRGLDRPEPLQPGTAYRLAIELGNTSVLFGAGHRIRLEVSSSNFPRYNRNPNTGSEIATEHRTRPARQTIWHDAEHPSHLTLPVIPR